MHMFNKFEYMYLPKSFLFSQFFFQRHDESYLRFLLDQHKSYQLNELFLTSDGQDFFEYGTLPGNINGPIKVYMCFR